MIDENNVPVQGFEFSFTGVKKIGILGVGTFLESSKTDTNGIYTIITSVPQGTDEVQFIINEFPFDDKLNRKNSDYSIFIEVGERFELRKRDEEPPIIGQTSIYNYQIKKR